MWDTLTPQQQQWIMQLMGRGNPQATQQMNPAMMQPGMNAAAAQGQPATLNPLMGQLQQGGGQMNPAQVLQLQKYIQMMNQPGGFATPGVLPQTPMPNSGTF